MAISPTHHHTYPPAQSAQLAPPHVSPVQHSHSPTVQMVDTIPHRIQQSQSRVHPGYTYTTTNQPAPPTQSQYTVNHGGYTQPHSQQFTGQNGQYHQQVAAAAPPPPPAVHPPPYRAAMVTSPHPPQPRRIEHCDSPMEYTNTRQHHPVRPRVRLLKLTFSVFFGLGWKISVGKCAFHFPTHICTRNELHFRSNYDNILTKNCHRQQSAAFLLVKCICFLFFYFQPICEKKIGNVIFHVRTRFSFLLPEAQIIYLNILHFLHDFE